MASPKAEQLNIKNVRGPGVADTGAFRIMGELFGWRNSRTSEILQLEAPTIESIEWIRISNREYMLSFTMKDSESRVEFTGFREHDYDVLQGYFKKHWNKTMTANTRLGTKGWHWGEWVIRNKRFCLDVDGKRTIEMPLNRLASATSNKADVILEIKRKENVNEDVVTEIKFCVPPPKEGDASDAAEFVKAVSDMDWRPNVCAQSILDASGLGTSDNSAVVCNFTYKNCLQPPGRFDVQFYTSSVRLHGKSFDYRISFDNISDAYILMDAQSAKLLLTLINPLKKGNTKYPAVIVCLEDKVEETLTINGNNETMEELKKQIPFLESSNEVTMMEHTLVGTLIKTLAKKKILGETEYKSSTGHPSFVCSHKIHSGWFYPLANEFVYLAKPVITVPFSDVASVNLGRTQGQQTRLFEFSISLKSGAEYEFNQVDRQELQPFVDFVQKKGLKMREMLTEAREEVERDEEEEEEDEDENEEQESEDEDFEEEEEEAN